MSKKYKGRKNSEDHKKKNSIISSNSRWVKKENKEKFIHKDKISKYLNNGWELGRVTSNKGIKFSITHNINLSNAKKNKIWINNGIQTKHINPNQLKDYLNNNWKKGRILKNKRGNLK